MWRVGILTASTKGARGERKDESGAVIREMVARIDGQVVRHEVLPDDRERIREALIRFADVDKLDLVLTTGGTGVGPHDVTPEATRAVIQREIPGIAEAMRITAADLLSLKIIDRIVPEPLGGAHRAPAEAITNLKAAVLEELDALAGKSSDQLRQARREKFLAIA